MTEQAEQVKLTKLTKREETVKEDPRDLEQVMYILVNKDLKMGKGKIGAQCAHVACAVTRILERHKPRPKYYEDWLNNGEPKVVLKATEDEMNGFIEKYPLKKSNDYWCVPIRDFGRTQVKANSLTALAFRPTMKKLVPPALRVLKLL